MRRALVLAVLCAVSADAHADKRLEDRVMSLDTEAAACDVDAKALARIATEASASAWAAKARPARENAERDVRKLNRGVAAFEAYCGEIRALIAFLMDHALDSYASLERDIDARDSKLHRLRSHARKLVRELRPIINKLSGAGIGGPSRKSP